jgi:hypothetical protein
MPQPRRRRDAGRSARGARGNEVSCDRRTAAGRSRRIVRAGCPRGQLLPRLR